MAGFSKAVQQNIANWIRGQSMPAPPASLFLALSTAPIKDDGIRLAEPQDTSYSRQPITLTAPVHAEATGTTVKNAVPAIFGPATVAWTRVQAVAIVDGSGNILVKGNLVAPRSAPIGDTLSFGINTLEFSVV